MTEAELEAQALRVTRTHLLGSCTWDSITFAPKEDGPSFVYVVLSKETSRSAHALLRLEDSLGDELRRRVSKNLLAVVSVAA